MNVERGKKKFSTIKSTKLNEAGGGWRGIREERSRRSGKVQRNDNSNNNNKKRQNKSAILNRFRPERVMGNNQKEKQKSRDD